mmetsp:Transcript_8692/g.12412  ORF Transcript_8692/g.12412 Transcript_8692/m.12412 type:complete len:226 (-) Transcript_8692:267-944(-)
MPPIVSSSVGCEGEHACVVSFGGHGVILVVIPSTGNFVVGVGSNAGDYFILAGAGVDWPPGAVFTKVFFTAVTTILRIVRIRALSLKARSNWCIVRFCQSTSTLPHSRNAIRKADSKICRIHRALGKPLNKHFRVVQFVRHSIDKIQDSLQIDVILRIRCGAWGGICWIYDSVGRKIQTKSSIASEWPCRSNTKNSKSIVPGISRHPFISVKHCLTISINSKQYG